MTAYLPLVSIHLQPPERKGAPSKDITNQLVICNCPPPFQVPDLKRCRMQLFHARGTLTEDSL